MTHLFDNYPSNTLPDNRYEFLPIEKEYKDIIIRGGEVEHCFKIPHNINDISECEVIFYQGIEQKLIIPDYRITLKDEYDAEDTTYENITEYCWAYYKVYDSESLAFNTFNKQTQVQLKIRLTDGSIEYSNIYKIKVLPTLFTVEDGE